MRKEEHITYDDKLAGIVFVPKHKVFKQAKVLNRVLCKEDSLEYDKNGRVIKADPVKEEE